jgi:hypothetical protein
MKNSHLYPVINIFIYVGLLVLLTLTNIRISPTMITVLVITAFVAGTFYHHHKSTLTTARIAELALLALIVQLSAISFL